MTEEYFDAGDEDQNERREREEALIAEEKRHFLYQVLNTYEGRAVIWNLLEEYRLFDETSLGDAVAMAASITFANQGKRLLQKVFTTHPHSYTLMQKEASERNELRGMK